MFRRGDTPEPPPPALTGLGPAPGYTVKRFDDGDALNAYLLESHVDRNDAFNTNRRFMGGVVPSQKVVALLKDGYLRDSARETAIAEHEYAHTWGAVHHDDGRGWLIGDRSVADMTPDELTAHVDAIRKAAAPTASFDWSRAFAANRPPRPATDLARR